ncbi:MAG: hypothetical protein K0R58_3765 [Ramlibacter sp.]|jgi:hypothetical protein|nr:hypothetical protein [Ramlibacter sp.]
MINTGLASHAQQRRRVRHITGRDFHKSEWMESGEDPILSPTVFLVEQPPHATLYSHFHGENQFQVVVQGSGTIGPHPLQPLTVHYAGAYTGYGPIVAGDEGLFYFTLRPVFEAGSKKTVEEMVRGPKRHMTSAPHDELDAAALKAIAATEAHELIALQGDGLAATVLRLPPDASARGLDPAKGGGQFFLVLGGSLQFQDHSLKRWETVFLSADEQPLEIRAGGDGLELLCLQVAPKDPLYLEAKLRASQ